MTNTKAHTIKTNPPITVAYQGIEGAYSHLACTKVFPQYKAIACEDFQTAIAMVEEDEVTYAMIPLENSTAGRVEEIYRLLPKTHLKIIDEHFEPVNHCLLGLPGAKLEEITRAASHPQALAQCFHRLEDNQISPVVAIDTALSAKELSELDRSAPESLKQAAIASPLASELYGLTIIAPNFQDIEGNTTRFIILAKDPKPEEFDPDQAYITSILFSVKNIPAALYKALGGFATNGVNLIKLESYMDGGTMTASHFHIDIEGFLEQKAMQRALDELRFFARDIRIIGSYAAHPYRTRHEFI